MHAMNPSEERQEQLSRFLRELAQDSPQGAPEELGVRLNQAFRLHHRRRRLVRGLTVAGIAACLLLGMAVFMSHRSSNVPPIVVRQSQGVEDTHSASKQQKPAVEVAPKSAVTAGAHKTVRPKVDRRLARKPRPAEETDTARFVALPTFDPDVPVGQSQVVRLELPGSALRLVGYPVDEELSERRVVTDVLLSQDGTPYAVRLVRARAVQ